MRHCDQILVRYSIWLCLEPQEHDFIECFGTGMSDTDNTPVITAFEDLFSTISTWEPNSNLLLDIGVHSLSESEYYFKYLTFRTDIPYDEHDLDLHIEQSKNPPFQPTSAPDRVLMSRAGWLSFYPSYYLMNRSIICQVLVLVSKLLLLLFVLYTILPIILQIPTSNPRLSYRSFRHFMDHDVVRSFSLL